MNNPHRHGKRMGNEMSLRAYIGEYYIGQVILDLGFDGNMLPRQTWESMGKLML